MQEILNVFGVDWRLLIIQAVNFGVLLALLYYFLFKPLLRLMDERQEKIAKGIRDAARAEEIKRSAREEERNIITAASQKAEANIEEAKKQAERERERIIAEAKERSRRIQEMSERERERMQAEALEESKEGIARLATAAAANILREKQNTATED